MVNMGDPIISGGLGDQDELQSTSVESPLEEIWEKIEQEPWYIRVLMEKSHSQRHSMVG
mgnify:CR=1 FL=1